MKWLVDLIVGLVKAIFSVSMDNPIEKKEEMTDVGHEALDNPDDIFCPSDW